jgi:hypothetical protein
MVGRCSQGRRRRKRTGSTGGTVTGDAKRGQTTKSASARALAPLAHEHPHSDRSRDHSDSNRDPTPLLGWDACPWVSEPTGLDSDESSTMLFDDRYVSTADDTFGNALNLLDIPMPTEDYVSDLQTAFATSSALDLIHPTMPPTHHATTATAATPHTFDHFAQQDTTRAPGAFDNKPGIRILFDAMSNLEANIGDSGSSIDKIMHTVKTSTKEVQRVIESRQWQLAVMGPMLALVVVDVALMLIESTVCRWSGSKTAVPNSPVSDQQSPCALILGQYMAESEEAAIVWRHFTIVELRRLRVLLEILGVYLDDPSRCQIGQQRAGRLKNSCAYHEQKVATLIADLQRHDPSAREELSSAF